MALISTFFTITNDDLEIIIGHGIDVIQGLFPLLAIIIGLGIALWFIDRLLHR